MEYKNPFEDPDADFYGKKVKDYKIPKRRKEEPKPAKPAEPLEKKVEPNPLVIQYEKEIRDYEPYRKEVKTLGWGGVGLVLISSLPVLLSKNYSLLTPTLTPLGFLCMIVQVAGWVSLITGAGFQIHYSKKIKGLEKKIRGLKK